MPTWRRLLLSAENVFDGFHEIHVSVRDTIIAYIKRMLLKCAHVDDSVVARSIIIARLAKLRVFVNQLSGQ